MASPDRDDVAAEMVAASTPPLPRLRGPLPDAFQWSPSGDSAAASQFGGNVQGSAVLPPLLSPVRRADPVASVRGTAEASRQAGGGAERILDMEDEFEDHHALPPQHLHDAGHQPPPAPLLPVTPPRGEISSRVHSSPSNLRRHEKTVTRSDLTSDAAPSEVVAAEGEFPSPQRPLCVAPAALVPLPPLPPSSRSNGAVPVSQAPTPARGALVFSKTPPVASVRSTGVAGRMATRSSAAQRADPDGGQEMDSDPQLFAAWPSRVVSAAATAAGRPPRSFSWGAGDVPAVYSGGPVGLQQSLPAHYRCQARQLAAHLQQQDVDTSNSDDDLEEDPVAAANDEDRRSAANDADGTAAKWPRKPPATKVVPPPPTSTFMDGWRPPPRPISKLASPVVPNPPPRLPPGEDQLSANRNVSLKGTSPQQRTASALGSPAPQAPPVAPSRAASLTLPLGSSRTSNRGGSSVHSGHSPSSAESNPPALLAPPQGASSSTTSDDEDGDSDNEAADSPQKSGMYAALTHDLQEVSGIVDISVHQLVKSLLKTSSSSARHSPATSAAPPAATDSTASSSGVAPVAAGNAASRGLNGGDAAASGSGLPRNSSSASLTTPLLSNKQSSVYPSQPPAFLSRAGSTTVTRHGSATGDDLSPRAGVPPRGPPPPDVADVIGPSDADDGDEALRLSMVSSRHAPSLIRFDPAVLASLMEDGAARGGTAGGAFLPLDTLQTSQTGSSATGGGTHVLLTRPSTMLDLADVTGAPQDIGAGLPKRNSRLSPADLPPTLVMTDAGDAHRHGSQSPEALGYDDERRTATTGFFTRLLHRAKGSRGGAGRDAAIAIHPVTSAAESVSDSSSTASREATPFPATSGSSDADEGSAFPSSDSIVAQLQKYQSDAAQGEGESKVRRARPGFESADRAVVPFHHGNDPPLEPLKAAAGSALKSSLKRGGLIAGATEMAPATAVAASAYPGRGSSIQGSASRRATFVVEDRPPGTATDRMDAGTLPGRGVKFNEVERVYAYEVENDIFLAIEYSRPVVGWVCLALMIVGLAFHEVTNDYFVLRGVNVYVAATWTAIVTLAAFTVTLVVLVTAFGQCCCTSKDLAALRNRWTWAQILVVGGMWTFRALATQASTHMTGEPHAFALSAVHPFLITMFGLVLKNTVFREEVVGISVLFLGFALAMLLLDLSSKMWYFAEVVGLVHGVFTASFLFSADKARRQSTVTIVLVGMFAVQVATQLVIVLLPRPGSTADNLSIDLTFSSDPINGIGGFVTPRNVVAVIFSALMQVVGTVCAFGALRFLPTITVSAAMVMSPLMSLYLRHLLMGSTTPVPRDANPDTNSFVALSPTSGGVRGALSSTFQPPTGAKPFYSFLSGGDLSVACVHNKALSENSRALFSDQPVARAASEPAAVFQLLSPFAVNDKASSICFLLGATVCVIAVVYVVYISSIKRQRVDLLLKCMSKRRKPKHPYRRGRFPLASTRGGGVDGPTDGAEGDNEDAEGDESSPAEGPDGGRRRRLSSPPPPEDEETSPTTASAEDAAAVADGGVAAAEGSDASNRRDRPEVTPPRLKEVNGNADGGAAAALPVKRRSPGALPPSGPASNPSSMDNFLRGAESGGGEATGMRPRSLTATRSPTVVDGHATAAPHDAAGARDDWGSHDGATLSPFHRRGTLSGVGAEQRRSPLRRGGPSLTGRRPGSGGNHSPGDVPDSAQLRCPPAGATMVARSFDDLFLAGSEVAGNSPAGRPIMQSLLGGSTGGGAPHRPSSLGATMPTLLGARVHRSNSAGGSVAATSLSAQVPFHSSGTSAMQIRRAVAPSAAAESPSMAASGGGPKSNDGSDTVETPPVTPSLGGASRSQRLGAMAIRPSPSNISQANVVLTPTPSPATRTTGPQSAPRPFQPVAFPSKPVGTT